jgi:pimeloyl-ACP methyl ester carboxylesterase
VTDPVERLVADYADRFGGGPSAREAIRVIVGSALRDAAPPTLPDAVRDAYQHLNSILGLEHAGEGAAPGDDREPFDAEGTYQAALLMDVTDPVSYGEFSLGGVLAPLRVLSFWTMKRRACAFGETGAAELLERLQDSSPDCRFHVMGHSFGCIVATAAIAGAPGTPGPRRAVDSLVLAQGAMSLWSFCADIPARPGRAGYFHRVVRERLVKGPTLVTTSTRDRAVRVFYPLGAGVSGNVEFGDANLPVYGGVGTFGVRGPGIQIQDETLSRVDESYHLYPGVVYNLKADTVIATSAGISGAHSDICHPEVARAVWRAVEEQPESVTP